MPTPIACPPPDLLDSFLLGRLPLVEVEQWAGHVEQCEQCTAYMNASTLKDAIIDALQNPGCAANERESPRVQSLITQLSRWGQPHDSPSPVRAADTPNNSSRDDPRKLFDFLSPPEETGEIGRLGPYRILELLGIGGMGIVFKAEDPSLHRVVALKVLQPMLANRAECRERFRREAQAAALVEHDNIVPIYHVGEERAIPYLAMPLLSGRSLDDLLKTTSKLDMRQVVQYGCQIAQGLKAAHDRGVIHRDIKPANIWIEAAQGGRAKILDFGLARNIGEDSIRLTRLGTVLGTPAFMAPEQANDLPVDHRCDLFSLGCVLYTMCTSTLPFAGRTTIGILASLANTSPTPPDKLNPNVPPILSDLIMKLLEKDPAQRISSAAEVIQVLNRLQVSAKADAVVEPGMARPARFSRRLSTMVAAGLLGLALLLVGVVMYQLYYRTENGTLVIEVDKEADVRFQNGELHIYDAASKLQYTLKASEKNKKLPAGKYLIKLATADGVKLETEKFEIVKNGQAKVRVTIDTPTLDAGLKRNDRSWDFTAGDSQGTTHQGTEFVDGQVWHFKGGKHLRFKSPGSSWLEATFELPPSELQTGGKKAQWKLEVYHTGTGTGSTAPGYSPVRVFLNGRQIWQGDPKGPKKALLPGGVEWIRLEEDVSALVRPGTNVLRWDYLGDAATHYWLKSFRVTMVPAG